MLFHSRYHLVVPFRPSPSSFPSRLLFLSPALHPASAVFFWIDGRRRPCFFSRPETPTHPLIACESAIRWDGGNGISLLTRDCCRRRPPCFLLLLRFFLLLLPLLFLLHNFVFSISFSSSFSSSRRRSLRLPSFLFSSSSSLLPFPLAVNPYDGIHPSFLRPRINTTVRWKTAQPESRSTPSISLSFSLLLFDIYFLFGRHAGKWSAMVFMAESNQSLIRGQDSIVRSPQHSFLT